MDFKTLKANRANAIEKFTASQNKEGTFERDPRYWSMTIDKETKVGNAVIRFLPTPANEEQEYVTIYEYGFKGPGGWYIEASRQTLGFSEKDPAAAYVKTLRDSDDPAKKKFYDNAKRKMKYIANIKVIDDPAKPENNGKVFLFKFGPSIMNIINGVMHPEEEDEVAMNPFDLWEGANFRLRSRKKEGANFANYEKSKFDKPSHATDGDEAALEALWASEYPLSPEIAPDKFKSFEELRSNLAKALDVPVSSLGIESESTAPKKAKVTKVEDDEDEDGDKYKVTSLADAMDESSGSSDDETAAFLQGLADDE